MHQPTTTDINIKHVKFKSPAYQPSNDIVPNIINTSEIPAVHQPEPLTTNIIINGPAYQPSNDIVPNIINKSDIPAVHQPEPSTTDKSDMVLDNSHESEILVDLQANDEILGFSSGPDVSLELENCSTPKSSTLPVPRASSFASLERAMDGIMEMQSKILSRLNILDAKVNTVMDSQDTIIIKVDMFRELLSYDAAGNLQEVLPFPAAVNNVSFVSGANVVVDNEGKLNWSALSEPLPVVVKPVVVKPVVVKPVVVKPAVVKPVVVKPVVVNPRPSPSSQPQEVVVKVQPSCPVQVHVGNSGKPAMPTPPMKVKLTLTTEKFEQLRKFSRSRKNFTKNLLFQIYDKDYLREKTVYATLKKGGLDEDVVSYVKHLTLGSFPPEAGMSAGTVWQDLWH